MNNFTFIYLVKNMLHYSIASYMYLIKCCVTELSWDDDYFEF